jgi:cation diffusion facilitator CzcD-associated flavoprotein CzcO
MHTLGYSFRPWREAKAIADGPAILNYIHETAREYGIDQKIRLGHRVRRATWSSAHAAWTVDVATGEQQSARFTCSFLYMCSGYYDYAGGYTPEWPGMEQFAGQVVHPQSWPDGLDVEGKRVVVIGSGATAVTLVPALAARAAHITMLQRSPSYVVATPTQDAIASWLHRRLPARLAHSAARWRSILSGMYYYYLARWLPAATKREIVRLAREQLGPGYDVDTHFTPGYNPWDQRLCVAPDADLFAAIRSGKASVVTDHIERFTESGIRLRSGHELAADVVVTATGLALKLMGGAELVVDGVAVDLAKTLSYKGVMYSDVPNLASAFGYTNASWTLKCELAAQYVCRLLNHMARHGYSQCTPRNRDPSIGSQPLLSFSSGYVRRSLDALPRQGSKRPWKMHQNYVLDLLSLRFAPVDDRSIEFTRPEQPVASDVRRGRAC